MMKRTIAKLVMCVVEDRNTGTGAGSSSQDTSKLKNAAGGPESLESKQSVSYAPGEQRSGSHTQMSCPLHETTFDLVARRCSQNGHDSHNQGEDTSTRELSISFLLHGVV